MLFDYKIYDLLASKMREQIANINLISSNIANVDTPNYKAKRIDSSKESFSDELMLKVTSQRHIQPSSGHSYRIIQTDDIARNDGNNVNIEKEMVNIAKAKGRYSQISSILKFKIHSMDSLLNELGKV